MAWSDLVRWGGWALIAGGVVWIVSGFLSLSGEPVEWDWFMQWHVVFLVVFLVLVLLRSSSDLVRWGGWALIAGGVVWIVSGFLSLSGEPVEWDWFMRWDMLFLVVFLVLVLLGEFGLEKFSPRKENTLPSDDLPCSRADPPAKRVRADTYGSKLKVAARAHGIKPWLVKLIILSPVVLALVYACVLIFSLISSTNIEWMIYGEHRPVEMFTFAYELLAGIWGLALAWHAKEGGEELLVVGFYMLFSAVMLWTAGEEVAWGQWIVGKEILPTPFWLEGTNEQGELTTHNVGILQDYGSELFRLSFGIGGLLGCVVSFWQRFWKVGVPTMLWPWFLVITIFSGIEVGSHYLPTHFSVKAFDALGVLGLMMIGRSEITEMIIGISGFLFVWLSARRLSSIRKVSSANE